MGAVVPLEHSKCSKIIFEKTHFGPIFAAFMVTKWLIFKAYGTPEGPKKAQIGLKMGSLHLFVHPKWPRSLSEKHVFDPFLTHLWPQAIPFSRHFGVFHGPKRITTGSKRAKTICFGIRNGLGPVLEEHILDPFLTHLWSQIGPFSRHFGGFHGPKSVTTGSKRAKITCFGIANGPRSLLEKHAFDAFLPCFCS